MDVHAYIHVYGDNCSKSGDKSSKSIHETATRVMYSNSLMFGFQILKILVRSRRRFVTGKLSQDLSFSWIFEFC